MRYVIITGNISAPSPPSSSLPPFVSLPLAFFSYAVGLCSCHNKSLLFMSPLQPGSIVQTKYLLRDAAFPRVTLWCACGPRVECINSFQAVVSWRVQCYFGLFFCFFVRLFCFRMRCLSDETPQTENTAGISFKFHFNWPEKKTLKRKTLHKESFSSSKM